MENKNNSEKFKLIHNLITYIEKYETEKHEDFSLNSFVLWLNSNLSEINSEIQAKNFNYNEFHDYKVLKEETEIKISRLISTLGKYAKIYSKQILDKTPLNSIDEFGFLASLLIYPRINKSELIDIHLLSISSGSEVIKRLLKHNFIEEFDNEIDKRSVLIQITPKGRELVIELFNKLRDVSFLISGNLNQFEKQQLSQILNKLNVFHDEIHKSKISDINLLIENYLAKI